jgi:diguanylate cyclase (GGDEF)-like protein
LGRSTMPTSRQSLIDRDIALRWSRLLALAVGLIGILVLVGWFFDVWYLKSFFIRSMTMRPNTAAALVLASTALLLLLPEEPGRLRRTIGIWLAILVSSIGALTLLQHATQINLGIDQLLFKDVGNPVTDAIRPTISSSLCLLVLGDALLLLNVRRSGGFRPTEALTLLAVVISVLSLVAYLYGVDPFVGTFEYAPMSIHTALAFLLLGSGVLLARSESGVLRILGDRTTGGLIARRLLPLTILIPFGLGLARLAGQRAGYYPNEFGTAAFVVAVIVIFFGAIWIVARRLRDTENEKTAAEQNLQRRTRFLQLLGNIGVSANESSSVMHAVQLAVDTICVQMGWSVGHAYLQDADGNLVSTDIWHGTDLERLGEFKALTDAEDFDVRGGIGGLVLESGRPEWVTGFARRSEFGRAAAAEAAGLVSALAFPVRIRSEVVGILEFFSEQEEAPDELVLDIMTGIGSQLARVIERSQSEEQLQAANAKLKGSVEHLEIRNLHARLLNEMGDLLQSCQTAEEGYEVIGDFGGKLFEGDDGALYVRNPSRTMLESVAVWGASADMNNVFPPGDCWALRRGGPFVTEPGSQLRCAHAAPSEHELLCVPMVAQGEILGSIHIRLHEGHPADIETRKALAISMGEQLGLAMANFRLRETLRNQSIRDPLTNLYNRRYVQESLEREVHRARRNKRPVSVVMLDVDHFKSFNDTFGHDAGDAVLKAVAAVFKSNVRKEDIVCRYGGEEFMLVLPDASLDNAGRRAEFVRSAVEDMHVTHDGRKLDEVTLSMGVASFPSHGQTWEAVVAAADAALYKAKRAGRNRVVLHENPPTDQEMTTIA